MLRKAKINSVVLFLAIVMSVPAMGQLAKVTNLPTYDNTTYHFGFEIGINQMFFTINRSDDLYKTVFLPYQTPDLNVDSSLLLGVNNDPVFGFNIGIVGDMRLGKYFNLRFTPTLTFGERYLNYYILGYKAGNPTRIDVRKNISSTFVDFPLLIKYKSKRYHNFLAYLLGGAQYSVDLASGAKKKDINQDFIVKLKKSDVYGIAGVGFDFYNPWFKLGIEIKMLYGFFDVLERENTIYTNGIDKLSSKIFMFSFTFE